MRDLQGIFKDLGSVFFLWVNGIGLFSVCLMVWCLQGCWGISTGFRGSGLKRALVLTYKLWFLGHWSLGVSVPFGVLLIRAPI